MRLAIGKESAMDKQLEHDFEVLVRMVAPNLIDVEPDEETSRNFGFFLYQTIDSIIEALRQHDFNEDTSDEIITMCDSLAEKFTKKVPPTS